MRTRLNVTYNVTYTASCFRYELWLPLYTAAPNIFGRIQIHRAHNQTLLSYRSSTQTRILRVQVSSGVQSAGQQLHCYRYYWLSWALGHRQRSSNRRTMLASRSVGTMRLSQRPAGDVLKWAPAREAETYALKAELNPVCHLLALLGARHILHVFRIRVKLRLFSKPQKNIMKYK